MASKKKSALFICLGNICRSPMAESIFRDYVEKKGLQDEWDIDSAAIEDWHVGLGPDKRAIKCLGKRGIVSNHKVRVIKKQDFTRFDYIFGMDEQNMKDLDDVKPPHSTAQLKMLGEYDPQKELIIIDPYYGDYEDFEKVFVQCDRCCPAFLEAASK